MSDMKCPFCGEKLVKWMGYADCRFWTCNNVLCEAGRFGHIADECIWQELIRTRKALEQSEICCTEWEKQALDYKAENISLSGDLERTRKALDKAKLILKNLLPDLDGYERLDVEKAITEITTLEQKDK